MYSSNETQMTNFLSIYYLFFSHPRGIRVGRFDVVRAFALRRPFLESRARVTAAAAAAHFGAIRAAIIINAVVVDYNNSCYYFVVAYYYYYYNGRARLVVTRTRQRGESHRCKICRST